MQDDAFIFGIYPRRCSSKMKISTKLSLVTLHNLILGRCKIAQWEKLTRFTTIKEKKKENPVTMVSGAYAIIPLQNKRKFFCFISVLFFTSYSGD